MEQITSLSNPLIKQARALNQKKARAETGLFLVEGIHHVGEAVDAGWNIETILYSPDMLTSSYARDLLSRIPRGLQPVSPHVMRSIADKENPQGIIAIARQKKISLEDLYFPRMSAALLSPQDPGNVGTILRTLDAVGADALFLLDGGVDPYHPTVIRASMGSLFWKPIVQMSFQEFIEWARGGAYQLIGSSAHADLDYHTLAPRLPWILLLGSEQKGLTREQIDACDVTVSLPMRGRASSLNLSVAAGIMLYRFLLAAGG